MTVTFPSKSLHLVPQLSPNTQSSFTKVFVYVINSIFQLTYISHYPFFILIRMQFENYGTKFVFVMAFFSARYSVGSLDFYIVYFKFRFYLLLTFSLHRSQISVSVSSSSTSSSSVIFLLFRVNDRVCFLHGFERFHLCSLNLYRFKFFPVNFVRIFYTDLKITEFTIQFIYSLAQKLIDGC